jgi:hypothetical protein
MISNAANAYGMTTQMNRSRGKIGMDISTARRVVTGRRDALLRDPAWRVNAGWITIGRDSITVLSVPIRACSPLRSIGPATSHARERILSNHRRFGRPRVGNRVLDGCARCGSHHFTFTARFSGPFSLGTANFGKYISRNCSARRKARGADQRSAMRRGG